MVPPQNDREGIDEQGVGFDVFAQGIGLEGQDYVQLSFLEHIEQLFHAVAADAEFYSGVLLEKVAQGLGQYGAEGIGRSDDQLSGNHILQIPHLLLATFGVL